MKIDAITLREIQMPLVHFFETSFGRTTHRRIILVQAHCEGVDGWGECVAGEGPFFNEEWTDEAWDTLVGYLSVVMIEAQINGAAESANQMARIRGHRMAK